MVVKIRVSQNDEDVMSIWGTLRFWRRTLLLGVSKLRKGNLVLYYIYTDSQRLPASLKAKELPDLSAIAFTEGSYQFQTSSFVKINQTPVLLFSVFTFFFSFSTLLCLMSLLLSSPLPPTLLHSLLKISSYNVNWFTIFTQVSQNEIIPSFSLWVLMEFHPSFLYGLSEIAFELYWMERK